MLFYSYEWIIAFVFAYTFFAMGKYDAAYGISRDHAWLWAGLSITLSAFVIRFITSQWQAVILSQIVLYIGIAAIRTWLDEKRK